MKKYLLVLVTLFTLISCEQEIEFVGVDANRDATKFDVCHYSPDTDTWEVINIAEIAFLKAHIDHGDTKLVDADNDGWVSYENACVPGGDCDDNNPNIHPEAIEVCDGLDNDCDGEIDEGCNQNGFADYSFESVLPNFIKGSYTILTDFHCSSSLTDDAYEVFSSDNLGGSSVISQSLAMNILNLLGYNLYKTSEEISYADPSGKSLDLLVSMGDTKFGVEVTRAFTFPAGIPYSSSQATALLESKLSDILMAESNLSTIDQIESSLLFIFALDEQHAQVITSVWNNLDQALKADTKLILMTTEGLDEFVYTGSINTDEEVCDGIDNDCDGVIDEDCVPNDFAELTVETTLPYFIGAIYDIYGDFDPTLLSNDAQDVYNNDNSGGSSLIPNSLAMNIMNLMGYSLHKLSSDITYNDPTGKMMNMLVSYENSNYGVVVTRAFAYPPGAIYSSDQATALLESRLSDIKQSEANLSNLNQVESSLLFVFAYNTQHFAILIDVWNNLDSTTKSNTTLILVVTEGSDNFIYGIN